MSVPLYMDVHVPLAIAEQLRRHGVDVLLFGHQLGGTIGEYVRDLELIAKASELVDWANVVERLPLQ